MPDQVVVVERPARVPVVRRASGERRVVVSERRQLVAPVVQPSFADLLDWNDWIFQPLFRE